MTKAASLHQLSIPELQTELAKQQKALVQARIAQRANKPVKGNTKAMADDIARILTVIKEKELAV